MNKTFTKSIVSILCIVLSLLIYNTAYSQKNGEIKKNLFFQKYLHLGPVVGSHYNWDRPIKEEFENQYGVEAIASVFLDKGTTSLHLYANYLKVANEEEVFANPYFNVGTRLSVAPVKLIDISSDVILRPCADLSINYSTRSNVDDKGSLEVAYGASIDIQLKSIMIRLQTRKNFEYNTPDGFKEVLIKGDGGFLVGIYYDLFKFIN